MSTFTQPVSFKPISNGRYVTTSEFRFYLDSRMIGEYVDIPVGTVFNGASIPKLIRKLFGWNPIDYRWLQATILHDALVGEHADKVKTSYGRVLNWKESAYWFDQALRIKREQYPSCPKLYRRLFVTSVRIYPTLKKLYK